MITEEKLSASALNETVNCILSDDEKLRKMSMGAKSIGICDATDKLYGILKELIEKRR